MTKFLAYILAFASIIAIVYCLVMYGPDKSISAKLQANELELEKTNRKVDSFLSKFHEMEYQDSINQAYQDSLLLANEIARKPIEAKLDSLIKATNSKAPKRLQK